MMSEVGVLTYTWLSHVKFLYEMIYFQRVSFHFEKIYFNLRIIQNNKNKMRDYLYHLIFNFIKIV